MKNTPQYLFVEPYYGGSHQAFIDGITRFTEGEFTLLALPARKWKLRMQLAAPYMAEQIVEALSKGARFDAIVTSTFLDTAVLKALLAQKGVFIPLGIYFHENQFAYPRRPEDTARHQFAAINCTSALCADAVAFNSAFNMKTCLNGIREYAQKAADFSMPDIAGHIGDKSIVLYPGLDFSGIDGKEAAYKKESRPVIVWNHRWEHDKNPEAFFQALFELHGKGADFQLVVLGESFRHQPEIMLQAREILASHILHFGYCQDKDEYASWLQRGTIVVSTAIHEFFGMGVLEAVRAGCRPLVPDRLAYPELFPVQYRYTDGQLVERLSELVDTNAGIPPTETRVLTDPYSWETIGRSYNAWLKKLRENKKITG
ncbi:MAG: DUF3524 domain-containing protein [Desulfobulbus sp.]|nr:DUF3524 domain-containing protein [Desulfobulbus sp.]